MKESQKQKKIIYELKKNGWFVTKLIQTTTNGIPDLLAIKNGWYIFIEVKSEKGKLSKLQEYRIKELKNFGANVIVI